MNNIPTDFEWEIDSLFYKQGLHNYIYIWLNDKWMKSCHKYDDIEQMLYEQKLERRRELKQKLYYLRKRKGSNIEAIAKLEFEIEKLMLDDV